MKFTKLSLIFLLSSAICLQQPNLNAMESSNSQEASENRSTEDSISENVTGLVETVSSKLADKITAKNTVAAIIILAALTVLPKAGDQLRNYLTESNWRDFKGLLAEKLARLKSNVSKIFDKITPDSLQEREPGCDDEQVEF